MPDASVSLALEADSFDRDLARSERNLVNSQNRMNDGSRRLAGSQDRLLESNNRVTNQIQGFSRSMLSARNAGDVLAAGLDRLENSTRMSLGAGAILAVGATLISHLAERAAALREVTQEIEKLSKATGAARFENLDALGEKLEKAKPGPMAQALRSMALLMSWGGSALVMDTPWGASGKYNKSLEEIAGLKKSRAQMTAEKAQDQNNLTNLRLTDGESAAAKREAEMARDAKVELAKGDAALIAAANVELDLAYKNIAAKEDHLKAQRELAETKQAEAIAERRRDRVQQTLGELAALPSSIQDIGAHGISLDRWETGEKARGAQQWEAYAEQLRMGGDMAGAHDAYNYATDIKRSIPGLKDSEKDLGNQLTGALDASKVLQEIEANTAKTLTNR